MTEKTIHHTPGPWEYCCDKCHTIMSKTGPVADITSGVWGDTYPKIRLLEGHSDIEGKYEVYIKKIAYGEIDPDVAKANAYLIAAAPDLLSCLEEIIDYSGGADSPLGDEYVMERVYSAITKAKGERS